MRDLLIKFVNAWLSWEGKSWILLGPLFGVAIGGIWAGRKNGFWYPFLLLAMGIAVFEVTPLLLLQDVSDLLVGHQVAMPENRWWGLPIGAAMGFAGLILLIRYGGTVIDLLFSLLTRRSALERNRRTDIRTISKHLPDPQKAYDPTRYFKLPRGVFIGLDEGRRPVYIPFERWRRSHVQVVGTTGSGKGVAAQIQLAQAAALGETVIVLDPKDDEYLPHVLFRQAQELGLPYAYIDLTSDAGQWNPLFGKSAAEIRELLSAAFGLAEKGTDADFYRLDDRRAARVFSDLAAKQPVTLRTALQAFVAANADLAGAGKKFVADCEEIALLPVSQTLAGLDMATWLEGGGFIYVRGTLRDPAVLKLQRLFVVSLIQHIERRDRASARPVCVFLDEFRFLVSRPTIEALASIRDKGAHMVIAHQSLGDLRDCPADLDAQSVVSAVNENCRLKLTYQVQDPDTADWLARMSGKILVDDETRRMKTNAGLAETGDPERTLRQGERALIDTNMLQALPERCAVLFGAGLAQFVFTSPIKVAKATEAVTPTFNEFGKTDALNVGQPAPRSVAEEALNVD